MAEGCDVVVIGSGAAGIAAARTAHEAGATVTLVTTGEGATAMAGGVVWGTVREPYRSWCADGELRVGGRYVTVAGWMVAGAVGALTSMLDLDALPPDALVGVVDWPVHPSWSARLVAQTLGARVVPMPEAVVGAGFLPVAATMDADGAPEALAEGLRSQCEGLRALLFPPVLGLQRNDVAAKLTATLGMPVGEAVAGAGAPPSVRLARAVRRWLPERVRVRKGIARVLAGGTAGVQLVDGTVLGARAVVLATGGLMGGGLEFGDSLREVTVGATVWTRGRRRVAATAGSARGADPTLWFGDTPDTARAAGAGLRVDRDARVLDADGETVLARWLFAAGDVVAARDPDAVQGIADALALGALAGTAAARHAKEG